MIPVIEVDLGPGIRAFFTTRDGGLSAPPRDSLNLGLNVDDDEEVVLANRARVDVELGAVVSYMTQVHGSTVRVVDGAPEGADLSCGTADALITAAARAPLGALVADCVPVLLADPGRRVVAVVHAGRAGVVAGIVAATVGAMEEIGARRGDIRAAVGPAICGGCYEVPQALQDEVADVVPHVRATTSWGSPSLDLPGAVAHELRRAGTAEVLEVGACTRTDTRFFSHRRATAERSVTGRFAGVVMLA
ncbi:peptidoglycan editing factor PgeF [Sanguibacter sp. 25GB23B1]|uniref:peptidoglycan editing factor PgeF n=1 Tax=unclassified Sanguibacter TaxID=2645534 RepID=UPI0032AEB474